MLRNYLTFRLLRSLSGLSAAWWLKTQRACLVGKTQNADSISFSASEPNHLQIGWCSLPLWSVQSTPPNVQWVPSEHVFDFTKIYPLSPSFLPFRFIFTVKMVWDAAVSPFLFTSNISTTENNTFLRHCFGPHKLWSKVTTREAHSELLMSGFYVTNYTRPIPFRQILRLGNGFSNRYFPPLWKFIENSGFDQ